MATIVKCIECPERTFDNPGSARGHANRMGHHTVEVDAALMGEETGTLEDLADEVVEEQPEPMTGIVLEPLTGELGAQLDELAERIRSNYNRGQKAVIVAWESRYIIGESLAQARKLLRGDLEYGRWVKEQDFPFAKTTQGYLTWVGNYLDEAQEIVTEGIETAGEPPALRKVAQELKNRHAEKKPTVEAETDEAEDAADEEATTTLSAEQVLNRFLYGNPALETFASAPMDAAYWADIPDSDRRTASREFRLLIDRMVAINDLWKEG